MCFIGEGILNGLFMRNQQFASAPCFIIERRLVGSIFHQTHHGITAEIFGDWILSLPAEVESGDYYAAEMWIGKSIPETEVNYTKHINLFHSEPFGNTYEVPIVPENYGNLDDHKTGKYAYLRTDYLMNLNGTAVAN
jgi:hypothetical protein